MSEIAVGYDIIVSNSAYKKLQMRRM